MERQGFRVLDAHVHFPWPGQWGRQVTQQKPAIQAYSRQRNQRMSLEWDFPESASNHVGEAKTWEELADLWAAEVDQYGLSRVNFVTGGGNANLHQVVRRHPDKFLGMAHHAIWEDGALDELRRAHEEYGFRGLKMLGPRIPVDFEDPKLTPVWEYLAEHRLPVLCHFGLLGTAGGVVYHKNINPLVIANVCRAYPDIPWIIPHFGCGYMLELLQLCWAFPNIHVDTSGSNQWMQWLPYEMNTQLALRKFYETIGPERIIFGTDSSWFPRGFSYRYLQDQVRDVRQMNWKQDDIALVFGGNAARLYGLEAK
ncbi:MAG TPA: amidohydrolase family protein [Symbiobacteriaceae bacterium]|nr:amidohydrolase family protein [Symbiobacteriaceae bacterium]